MNGAAQDPGQGRGAGPLLVAAGCAFLLLVMVPAIGYAVARDAGWLPARPTNADELALGREGGLVLFSLAAVAIWAFSRLNPLPLPWRPAAVRSVLATYVPLAVCWWLLLVGYLRAAQALGLPVVPQDTLQYFAGADPARPGFWLACTATMLFAPLAEEIVFRGYLQGALRASIGPRAAVVAQGLLFGLVHGFAYALPIALLGVFFGWLRERHGSLLAPLVAHAVHNASVALSTLLFPGSLQWLYT